MFFISSRDEREILFLITLDLFDFVGVLSVQLANGSAEMPFDVFEDVQGLFRVDQVDGQSVLAEPS